MSYSGAEQCSPRQESALHRQLRTRTIPIIEHSTGLLAIDIHGRYVHLREHEHALDGETLVQCPCDEWNVEDLERALHRNYENAVRRHSGQPPLI